MAATRALAALAREDVPDAVLRAYGVDRLRFGADYLIPKPFDPRVLLWVAPAVARAAMDSGVAGVTLDLEEYYTRLEARLGPARAVMRGLTVRAATAPKRVVFPEGEEGRIIRAARILVDEGVAEPVLLGRRRIIEEQAAETGVELDGVTVLDPADAPEAEGYARAYWTRRQRKGVTLREARENLRQPIYYGAMMLAQDDADALIAGEATYYPETLRPALETVGPEGPEHAVCSIYMLLLPQGTFFLADTTVNIDPDPERLAAIARATADFVRGLGIEPRVALLSFSNFGSARHPTTEKVARAVRILHEREPGLIADGEMQADTAVVESLIRSRYPFSRLQKRANILVFPDLNAANIAYKLLIRLGGAQAIGPILVGMARPVHVLQRDSDVNDIVNIAVLAVVDAQERARRAADGGTGSPSA